MREPGAAPDLFATLPKLSDPGLFFSALCLPGHMLQRYADAEARRRGWLWATELCTYVRTTGEKPEDPSPAPRESPTPIVPGYYEVLDRASFTIVRQSLASGTYL
jgi:hypothetical protein